MRRRIQQVFQVAGITLVPHILETSSILATTSIISKTDSLSVLPSDVAQHYAKAGLLNVFSVKLPLPMAKLGLITRNDRDTFPALMAFITALKTEFRTTTTP